MGKGFHGLGQFLLRAVQPDTHIGFSQAVDGGDVAVAHAVEVQQQQRTVERRQLADVTVEQRQRFPPAFMNLRLGWMPKAAQDLKAVDALPVVEPGAPPAQRSVMDTR